MNDKKIGIVYLAGAGPGDPGLVTVKTFNLLKQCDAVVYDYLIPDELITTLPEHVEKYYVGKIGGGISTSQTDINELLLSLARQNKTVVRLKGSDPFVFGRGGEEAKFLAQNKINFEIIPGVTAGVAASTYAGIPVTDRNIASWVTFVTGHKAKEKLVSSVKWDWIAKGEKGTVVLYMGVSQIANIVSDLIENGMKGDTPSAIIERASFPTQKTHISILKNLPQTVVDKNIKAPAIFIIGDVVNLREYIEWFGKKPLHGLRILVTRPADQANTMYNKLRNLGAEVLPYPTIATRENINREAWNEVNKIDISNNWLIFTSENGVRYFIKQMKDQGKDIRSLSDYKIAVIGEGTKRALAKYYLKPDFIPDKATTSSLAEQFIKEIDLKGFNFIRVRGNLSVENIDNAVLEAGGNLIPMTVYETYYPVWGDELKEKIKSYPPDIVTFTSGSTVDGLFNCLDSNEIYQYIKQAMLVSIGPSTSEVIKSYGLDVTLEAKKHTIPDLINELVEFIKSNPLER